MTILSRMGLSDSLCSPCRGQGGTGDENSHLWPLGHKSGPSTLVVYLSGKGETPFHLLCTMFEQGLDFTERDQQRVLFLYSVLLRLYLLLPAFPSCFLSYIFIFLLLLYLLGFLA